MRPSRTIIKAPLRLRYYTLPSARRFHNNNNRSSSEIITMSSAAGVPSTPAAPAQHTQDYSTTTAGHPDAASLGIESTDIRTAEGVQLSEWQKVVVGSVLDLFKGKPTLAKTKLWADDATFADPITKAEGRKQYEAQWWGLKAAFSEIEQKQHSVTSSGNPLTLSATTRYKVKGLGAEKVIESEIRIHMDAAGEKIVKVEDRWNGNIPEGPIATAFRNLNSVVVPAFVSVPKDDGK